MAVEIVNPEPAPGTVRETVCPWCGVTLSYIPADVCTRYAKDVMVGISVRFVIDCPKCEKEINTRYRAKESAAPPRSKLWWLGF